MSAILLMPQCVSISFNDALQLYNSKSCKWRATQTPVNTQCNFEIYDRSSMPYFIFFMITQAWLGVPGTRTGWDYVQLCAGCEQGPPLCPGSKLLPTHTLLSRVALMSAVLYHLYCCSTLEIATWAIGSLTLTHWSLGNLNEILGT